MVGETICKYTHLRFIVLLESDAAKKCIKRGDMGVKVNEGHWQCHHSTQRVRLPIRLFCVFEL